MRPARVLKSAIGLKPSTLLRFHQMLVKREYRALFSSKHTEGAGARGRGRELINVVCDEF